VGGQVLLSHTMERERRGEGEREGEYLFSIIIQERGGGNLKYLSV